MTIKLKTTKWLNNRFESSSYKTPEFLQFARDFKSDLKNLIGDNPKVFGHYKLSAFSVGHFYISGFIQNKNTGKLAYFSIDDVRFSPDAWTESVLIRTATSLSDYTGGMNQYTQFLDIAESLENLTA